MKNIDNCDFYFYKDLKCLAVPGSTVALAQCAPLLIDCLLNIRLHVIFTSLKH